jgi:hypothetical protein
MQGLQFDVLDASFDWKVTTLPPPVSLRYAPNVTAVWGIDDTDVHFATFKGFVYHWNGSALVPVSTGVDTGLNHIHGSGPTDIYCVGDRGVVLHYDGSGWDRIATPPELGPNVALTGVRAVSPDEVFICGRGGSILHGSSHGLHLVGQPPTSFYSLAHFQDRLLLAGGDSGVWELQGNRASVIKSTFASVRAIECRRRVVFLEPNQEPRPCVIQYEPGIAPEWIRTSF